jgi:hypothetical protein
VRSAPPEQTEINWRPNEAINWLAISRSLARRRFAVTTQQFNAKLSCIIASHNINDLRDFPRSLAQTLAVQKEQNEREREKKTQQKQHRAFIRPADCRLVSYFIFVSLLLEKRRENNFRL